MKKNYKKYYKKFILIAIICLIPWLLGILSPREKEKASAQIERGVVCDKVIPIGEAIFETNNLLSQVFAQTQNIRREVETQIKTASGILATLGENAQKCEFSQCKAVCQNISIPVIFKGDFWPFVKITYPACIPMCGEVVKCQGKPCPDIQTLVSAFATSSQKLTGFKNNVENLIGPVLERKDIKPVTEDIKQKKSAFYLWQYEKTVEEYGEKYADKISVIEWIKRKLDRARAEFKSYSIPASEWKESLGEGLSPKKFSLRCKDVIEYGYPIEWVNNCRNLCDPEKSEFDEIECLKCLCGGNSQNWLGCQRK